MVCLQVCHELRGDGEGEQTKEAVAKVGSNGGSVGIEGELEVF
jgi:hypothetical protein